ncbi:MAG TPA: cell division FtsA domain-containing protein [Verrucomicrobiae bacterium]|jgi:Tfp pilus assembly PilM family ATPase|nr:cell division FtsA domain-containing protein [Verrucomicrobiae bacterium]
MNSLPSNNATGLFIDIGQSSLQAVFGDDAFAFPIERGENGRLTDLCRERLALSLRGFLSKKGRATDLSAFCAIGARGVSMRRLTLPASSGDELRRVLRLQIESEFPLSPEELAWGSRPVGSPNASANGGAAKQELLVVAVKKEVLEDYTSVLVSCGVAPTFTLAALSRADLHPPPTASCAVLDIGRTHSELTSFDHGVPTSIRILAWGGETITRAIQEKLAVSHDEAEKLKMALDQPSALFGPQVPLLQSATESALAELAEVIRPVTLGGTLYLTGKSARNPRLAALLAGVLSDAVSCESLAQAPGGGPSAVIAGLMKSTARNGTAPPLILESGGGQMVTRQVRPAVWKWAAAAVLLALGAICFPYAEALVFKPFLEKKLAALQADRGRLTTIDQELEFLKFLKENQPPYLDTIYLLAKSAPQGTSLESLTMSRHPEITLRLKMPNSQGVTDFRAKLIDTGWFTNVMVEEQAMSPDRRMSVRMTAELRAAQWRKPLPVEPPSTKTDRQRLAGPVPDFNMPPPEPMMMMPQPPPTGVPVQAAPAPPPGGPDTQTPPRVRRRPRIQTTPDS